MACNIPIFTGSTPQNGRGQGNCVFRSYEFPRNPFRGGLSDQTEGASFEPVLPNRHSLFDLEPGAAPAPSARNPPRGGMGGRPCPRGIPFDGQCRTEEGPSSRSFTRKPPSRGRRSRLSLSPCGRRRPHLSASVGGFASFWITWPFGVCNEHGLLRVGAVFAGSGGATVANAAFDRRSNRSDIREPFWRLRSSCGFDPQ